LVPVGHASYAQHHDVSRFLFSPSPDAKALGNEKLLSNLHDFGNVLEPFRHCNGQLKPDTF